MTTIVIERDACATRSFGVVARRRRFNSILTQHICSKGLILLDVTRQETVKPSRGEGVRRGRPEQTGHFTACRLPSSDWSKQKEKKEPCLLDSWKLACDFFLWSVSKIYRQTTFQGHIFLDWQSRLEGCTRRLCKLSSYPTGKTLFSPPIDLR